MLKVELVYIPAPEKPPLHLHLTFLAPITVRSVLEQSGILERYPEVSELSIGIFGTLVSPDTIIKPNDRLEIYRPLLTDPKEKRRQRAKQARE